MIMNFFKKITVEWPLRIGFALMYFYSGWDIFIHPQGWYWALPTWFSQLVSSFVSIDLYLKVQGISEIVLGLILLAWFLKPSIVKWFALLSAVEMAGILLLSGINSITFRDIGLLGGAISLAMLMFQNRTRFVNISTPASSAPHTIS